VTIPMRLLLDTNVWGMLVKHDGVQRLRRMTRARGTAHRLGGRNRVGRDDDGVDGGGIGDRDGHGRGADERATVDAVGGAGDGRDVSPRHVLLPIANRHGSVGYCIEVIEAPPLMA
jgi:hypothetical protein